MKFHNFYFHIQINGHKGRLYDEYWKFATERQNIFIRRNVFKQSNPWTKDEILKKYKFTNVYRANDRVSQYLLRSVIYKNSIFFNSEEDTVFRILLFKIFNKIDTWKAIEGRLGEIYFYNHVLEDIRCILDELFSKKTKLYSGAYIMPSGISSFGYHQKYLNHLALLEMMIRDQLALKITKCKTMKQLYELLLSYPMIGSFLAYQYATDINYSEVTNFDEMEFVVPGPGAISGIQKCFLDIEKKNYADIIKYVCYNQRREFERLGLNFITLRGRPLQLIDCQNLFCEFDKYARAAFPEVQTKAKRKRIKQVFKRNSESILFFYPPKWHLNNNWK